MFKRVFACLIGLLFFLHCEKDKNENFTLTGKIEGLKKGSIYLLKLEDSSLITIDSAIIKGSSNFSMRYDLEEPEVLYLRLNKNDNAENILSFFADSGNTKITSTIKNFIYDAKIEGSIQQKQLEEYMLNRSKFNDLNLELIKKSLQPGSTKDSTFTEQLDTEFNSLLKRKYLYTINYAYNNRNSEIAPYLAVTEIPNANKKFLDTIYSGLSKEIKESKYGKQLKLILEQNL